MSLEDAYIRGYQRCDRCYPPEYTGTAERGRLKEKSEGGSSSSSSYSYSKIETAKSFVAKEENKQHKGIELRTVFGILVISLYVFCMFGLPIISDVRKRKEREKRRES